VANSGQTIGQAAIRLSKNGGDYAQSHNASGATYDEGNQYDVPLDATDTGTCGRLTLYLNGTGFQPAEFFVVPANVYYSLVGVDLLEVEAGGEVTIGQETLDAIAVAYTQPRVNDPVESAFVLPVSRRRDGTHKCTMPMRVRPGAVGNIRFAIQLSPLYGKTFCRLVGEPTIDGGSVVVTAAGPRDTQAIVVLTGVATASEQRVVNVPVTMQTGESFDVACDLIVFDD
jgi:hypothetical protein